MSWLVSECGRMSRPSHERSLAISTARQFFEELIGGGFARVEALVTNAVYETEWLDFKSGEHLKDVKETSSEAICGFGNNQGGILVCGVDARKDKETGFDVACDVKPVTNPATLCSKLIELLRFAVEPPLPGVELRESLRSDGTGFVVCFIPESTTKPQSRERLNFKHQRLLPADFAVNEQLHRSFPIHGLPISSPSQPVECLEIDQIADDSNRSVAHTEVANTTVGTSKTICPPDSRVVGVTYHRGFQWVAIGQGIQDSIVTQNSRVTRWLVAVENRVDLNSRWNMHLPKKNRIREAINLVRCQCN